VSQDCALELLQRRARFETEAIDERCPRLSVRIERLGLAPRSIQGEHELPAEPLAQRVIPDQRFELGNDFGMAAERQVGVDAELEGRQTNLLESRDRRLRERLVGQIRQRRTAPERERFAQVRGRPLRLATGKRLRRLGRALLEPVQVHLLGAHA